MTEYPGSGDPKRTLELLWGRVEPATRGPRPALHVEDIVAAATDIADAHGLDAMSIRSVARQLGRSPMSLYTYLPGKAELLDLMYDRALAELPRRSPGADGWRPALEAAVRDLWALNERHPWMVQVSSTRGVLGPATFELTEMLAAILDGIGLSGPEVVHAIGAVTVFVQGAARAVLDARSAAAATGMTDDEWWAARAPLLEELTSEFDWPTRFPTLTRLDSEQVFAQTHRTPEDTTTYMEREALDIYEFGLRCLLDGIESMAQRARPVRRPRRSRSRAVSPDGG
jgi:AcrR family transcriptional regulator